MLFKLQNTKEQNLNKGHFHCCVCCQVFSRALSYGKKSFFAKNQILRSYRVYILPTK